MKNLFAFLELFVLSNFINSQENQQQDSTKVQLLDEVLLTAIRVDATSPITHSDVTKEHVALSVSLISAHFGYLFVWLTQNNNQNVHRLSVNVKNAAGYFIAICKL